MNVIQTINLTPEQIQEIFQEYFKGKGIIVIADNIKFKIGNYGQSNDPRERTGVSFEGATISYEKDL